MIDIEKILRQIDYLYDKYGVDKSFYFSMNDEQKIKGMKGILAELDFKKNREYDENDSKIIKDIYFICC